VADTAVRVAADAGATATAGRAARPAGVPARVALWAFHLALPLAGLALLLAVPAADVRLEHHPTHFWLVALAAAVNVGLAVLVARAARRHADARLTLVGLGFLAAALFLGLHALATPGVLLGSRNGGFALATPVGLALAALCTAASALDLPPAAVLRAAPWLRRGLLGLAAVWGAVSLAGLPPLADPALAEQLSGPLVGIGVASVLLYGVVTVRYLQLYRRRRSVVLLSILTANVLLAESMIAVVLGPSWHLTWWLWHVLMTIAFGYIAYSAYAGYQAEGATTGLFDGVRTEETVQAVRASTAPRSRRSCRRCAGRRRGDLRRGDGADHRRDGGAVRAHRGPDGRARPGRVGAARGARADRPARRAGGDRARVAGRARRGRPAAPRRHPRRRGVRRSRRPDRAAHRRRAALARRALHRPGWTDAPDPPAGVEPVLLGDDVLACPLTVKDLPAGVLLVRRAGGFTDRDRSLLASLASQLSMGLENARLYHQIDGLFRQYMSPDVATALLADPAQAALGGAVVEVTAVFADLRGFTTFSERSSPEEVVELLNRYFAVATAAVLAEGGTVVQFVGDAMMALFGAPPASPTTPCAPPGPRSRCRRGSRRSPTPTARRSASGSTPGRRSSATSAAPRCATSTPWATR
jgi:class 3 adenylate cyclase